MNKKEIAEKLSKWIDIANYWLDDIQDLGERFDTMHQMYMKYDKMIDDMYNLMKELENETQI